MKRPIVIFDMDGVLINSIPAHYDTYRRLFARFGIKYSFHEFITKDITAGSMNVIPRVMKAHGKHTDVKEAMKEKNYIMGKERVPLNRGVVKLIRSLKRDGYKIAVASGGSKAFVHYILMKHGIHHYFRTVLSGDDGVRKKPFPDIYLKTAHKLRAKPSDCLVIEDSHDGVTAAKRAGMRVIGHKVRIERQDIKHADYVVNSMAKIDLNLIVRVWGHEKNK